VGYENPILQDKKSKNQPHIRILLPRTGSALKLSDLALNNHVFNTTFQDAKQYIYFLHFRQETASELTYPFTIDILSRVTLQACKSEPALILLTTAIGALDKATKIRDRNEDEQDAALHQEYALLHYGQALKGIKRIINMPTRESPRILLIAAFLIFCFENLQGAVECAVMNMTSALQLMRQQLSRTPRRYSHVDNLSPTADLEDSLVAAFVRLDNSILSRLKNSSMKTDRSCIKRGILDIAPLEHTDLIPDIFRDMTEAKNHLENIEFQYLPIVVHELRDQLNGTPKHPDSAPTDIMRIISLRLRKWKEAFAPLYNESLSLVGSGNNFVGEAMLRVQAIVMDLAVRRVGGEAGINLSSTSFDQDSLEVLGLCRCVAADPSFRRTFVFDCGIVPGLFIVFSTSQNKTIQAEALRILKSIVPRREGVWDSTALVEMAETSLLNAFLEKAATSNLPLIKA
jgi:hypothetical protein